jgi:tol-pal system protein YbgF
MRACALALSVGLCGCVTVQEYRALEREVAELKAAQESGALPASRLAELGARLDELERELGVLRGDIEETRHLADQALSRAEARATTSAPAPSPAPAPRQSEAPTPTSGGEVQDYEEAFRVYRLGDYEVAIDRFRAFLQNYPSSDYADNALFWMGECHVKLGDQERAVLTFQDVVKQYPDGNKVPDALYRQGIALMELGRKTGQEDTYYPAAREVFDRIVRDYPHSERVPEAKRQLEKLTL